MFVGGKTVCAREGRESMEDLVKGVWYMGVRKRSNQVLPMVRVES